MVDFGGETQKRSAIQVFEKFDVLLSIFHSCLNPLVYGTLTRRFRRGYIRYLVCLCPYLRDRISNATASTTVYHYQDCNSPTNQNGLATDHAEKTPLARENPERETKNTAVTGGDTVALTVMSRSTVWKHADVAEVEGKWNVMIKAVVWRELSAAARLRYNWFKKSKKNLPIFYWLFTVFSHQIFLQSQSLFCFPVSAVFDVLI